MHFTLLQCCPPLFSFGFLCSHESPETIHYVCNLNGHSLPTKRAMCKKVTGCHSNKRLFPSHLRLGWVGLLWQKPDAFQNKQRGGKGKKNTDNRNRLASYQHTHRQNNGMHPWLMHAFFVCVTVRLYYVIE